MSVKAQGESGIVIRHEKYVPDTENGGQKLVSTDWATTANAGMAGHPSALKPTSTINLSNWYHTTSSQMDDADATQDKGRYLPVSDEVLGEYVLKTQFAIRSAQAGVPIQDKDLAVLSVAVDPDGRNSPNLNTAVRVGVQIGETFYIYAPLRETAFQLVANYTIRQTGTTPGENEGDEPIPVYSDPEQLTEKIAASSSTDTFDLDDNTIPADDGTAIKAYVYIWYEGEDEMCKSTNITATVDELKVTVRFTTITPVSA